MTLPYHHRQVAPTPYILVVVIALCTAAGWMWRAEFWAWFSMALVAAVCGLVILTMSTLTVEDTADALAIRFGPVSVFSSRIPYASIDHFEITRSRIIDGWGIHYAPGRGWTWNLWGRDCVVIDHNGAKTQLGTDDPKGLAQLLESRVEKAG